MRLCWIKNKRDQTEDCTKVICDLVHRIIWFYHLKNKSDSRQTFMERPGPPHHDPPGVWRTLDLNLLSPLLASQISKQTHSVLCLSCLCFHASTTTFHPFIDVVRGMDRQSLGIIIAAVQRIVHHRRGEKMLLRWQLLVQYKPLLLTEEYSFVSSSREWCLLTLIQ